MILDRTVVVKQWQVAAVVCTCVLLVAAVAVLSIRSIDQAALIEEYRAIRLEKEAIEARAAIADAAIKTLEAISEQLREVQEVNAKLDELIEERRENAAR